MWTCLRFRKERRVLVLLQNSVVVNNALLGRPHLMSSIHTYLSRLERAVASLLRHKPPPRIVSFALTQVDRPLSPFRFHLTAHSFSFTFRSLGNRLSNGSCGARTRRQRSQSGRGCQQAGASSQSALAQLIRRRRLERCVQRRHIATHQRTDPGAVYAQRQRLEEQVEQQQTAKEEGAHRRDRRCRQAQRRGCFEQA